MKLQLVASIFVICSSCALAQRPSFAAHPIGVPEVASRFKTTTKAPTTQQSSTPEITSQGGNGDIVTGNRVSGTNAPVPNRPNLIFDPDQSFNRPNNNFNGDFNRPNNNFNNQNNNDFNRPNNNFNGDFNRPNNNFNNMNNDFNRPNNNFNNQNNDFNRPNNNFNGDFNRPNNNFNGDFNRPNNNFNDDFNRPNNNFNNQNNNGNRPNNNLSNKNNDQSLAFPSDPLPVDAKGDADLVKMYLTWDPSKQPFWLLNSRIIETARNSTDPTKYYHVNSVDSRVGFIG